MDTQASTNLTKTSLFGTIAIAAVLFASVFLLLYHLGAEPLQDYDEATYAEVSAESIASQHYFSLTFLHENYFRKPPAIFWAMDVSESFIANPEVAARLPSALSALALIALVILFAFEATGNIYAAAAAGAILATTSAYIEPARQARLDLLVSFFIVASVYFFFKAIQKGRVWYICFGISLGLAVLTKGPLAIYAIIPVLAIAASYRTYKWILDPYFSGSVLTFFIVVLPWHLSETFHHGTAFWEEYLGDQVFDRVGQMLFNGPTNAQYFEYLFSFALPWSVVFCVGLAAVLLLWKKMQPKARALSAASIAGVFIILLICCLTKTKAISYLIPLYPFMALAIAVTGYEVLKRIPVRMTRDLFVLGFLLLVSVGFEASIYNGFHINSYYETQVTLAQNEKAIAEQIIATHATNFYVYDVTTLGSIMFYTKLLDPLGFSINEKVPSNSLLLFPTSDLSKLQSVYPKALTILYTGSTLDLGKLE